MGVDEKETNDKHRYNGKGWNKRHLLQQRKETERERKAEAEADRESEEKENLLLL